jgi:hypothetical protein
MAHFANSRVAIVLGSNVRSPTNRTLSLRHAGTPQNHFQAHCVLMCNMVLKMISLHMYTIWSFIAHFHQHETGTTDYELEDPTWAVTA